MVVQWKRVSPEPLNQAHPLDPSLSPNPCLLTVPYLSSAGSTCDSLAKAKLPSTGESPEFCTGAAILTGE
jgi:hypothetical protein